MYKHAYPLVTYPNIEVDALSISVEALNRERAILAAPQLFDLIVRAYPPQFEGDNKPLPVGTFATQYGIEHLEGEDRTERLEWYAKRINKIYNLGGNFHVVFHPGQAGRLIGSFKALPGEAMEEHTGQYGVAEVLVDPMFQRLGIGAAMLHAGITYGFKEPNNPSQGSVTDIFNANTKINKWYKRLGFSREKPSGKLKFDNDSALRTTYYTTPPGITLAAIAQNLEAGRPQLALNFMTPLHK
ncbi:MAG TPA: GNAT family N-acetyltransferase [Bacillota bacterium]|nr:GNAT family N-acetyltransferase [Bacillota bacterium]